MIQKLYLTIVTHRREDGALASDPALLTDSPNPAVSVARFPDKAGYTMNGPGCKTEFYELESRRRYSPEELAEALALRVEWLDGFPTETWFSERLRRIADLRTAKAIGRSFAR